MGGWFKTMKTIRFTASLAVTATMLFSGAAFADKDSGAAPEEVVSTLSETDTSYVGARILKQGTEIFGGFVAPGVYDGDNNENDEIERYGFWQGDTLFFGAENPESGNTVDGIAEFYWFESSIPKSSDFYVMVLKVKSAPNVVDDWKLTQEDNWLGEFIYDIDPCQYTEVNMPPNGEQGALRWDWSVPFQNYKWEPVKTIQMEESYSAGYDISGGASASADPVKIAAAVATGGASAAADGATAEFKEGGFLKDITSKVDIQSKGYMNKKFSVSSKYSVTLYKWEMVVQGGAGHMIWNLIVSKDGSAAKDSAYHEYFVVVQAPQATTVKIDAIDIAGNFRHDTSLWFDGWDRVSMALQDIEFTPPTDIECYIGDEAPEGLCPTDGVCDNIAPVCAKGEWLCVLPDTYESEEISCDGIDNDCDGNIDETLERICASSCGKGTEVCAFGEWIGCSAPAPAQEVCDGFDNDCDGLIDNSEDCYPFVPDYWADSSDESDESKSSGNDEWNDGGSGSNGYESEDNSDYSWEEDNEWDDGGYNTGSGNSGWSPYSDPSGAGHDDLLKNDSAAYPPGPQAGCSTGTSRSGTLGTVLIFALMLLAMRRRTALMS